MKKKFSIFNLRVRGKLILFSSVLLFFLIGLGIVSINVVNLTNKAHNARYENYGVGELEIVQAFSNFHEIKVHIRNLMYIYKDDVEQAKTSIETINAKVDEMNGHLDNFAAKMDNYSDGLAENFEQCRGYMGTYIDFVNEIGNLIVNGQYNEEAESEILSVAMPAANKTEEEMRAITTEMQNDTQEASERIKTQTNQLRVIVVAICVLVAVIVMGFCLALTKMLTVPIRRLSIASKKLAVGDIEVDCQKIHDDDLGELLDDFAHMAETIKEQAYIAEHISQGDLTVRVEPKGEKDVLGRALYKLVADNNTTLGSIKDSTKQVSVGAEQVSAASQSLAQGSTEQASAIQQVSASMDDIAEHTQGNADEANTANQLVHSVKDMAVSGNEQMKSMIIAMDEINESSETISKIIKVIDDIAFQTNILALNAAVEAARAGEHGKGFAVVADEVRSLAAKSAAAASETAEMIENSIEKVNKGAELAEETARALEEIVASIDRVVELIDSIADASNNQTTAVSQINQAISQVSQVVQTNSATSEQCAAASAELSNQSSVLKDLIANYKLQSEVEEQNSYDSRDDWNQEIIL